MARWTVDSGAAVLALVCSVLGICTSILIPLLGILFSGLGLTFGQKARNSVKPGMAKVAVILGTAGIAIAAGCILVNLFRVLSILYKI